MLTLYYYRDGVVPGDHWPSVRWNWSGCSDKNQDSAALHLTQPRSVQHLYEGNNSTAAFKDRALLKTL